MLIALHLFDEKLKLFGELQSFCIFLMLSFFLMYCCFEFLNMN